MISGLPYGPIRPRDIVSFTYYAGAKFGYIRHLKYVCDNPEGRPRIESPIPPMSHPWDIYLKSIS